MFWELRFPFLKLLKLRSWDVHQFISIGAEKIKSFCLDQHGLTFNINSGEFSFTLDSHNGNISFEAFTSSNVEVAYVQIHQYESPMFSRLHFLVIHYASNWELTRPYIEDLEWEIMNLVSLHSTSPFAPELRDLTFSFNPACRDSWTLTTPDSIIEQLFHCSRLIGRQVRNLFIELPAETSDFRAFAKSFVSFPELQRISISGGTFLDDSSGFLCSTAALAVARENPRVEEVTFREQPRLSLAGISEVVARISWEGNKQITVDIGKHSL